MPLSPSSPRRRLHVRTTRIECFARDDGDFDIEARLLDVKDQDCTLLTGVRRAGESMHDIWVRVTVGPDLVVRAVEAKFDAMPYPTGCSAIEEAYRQLAGAHLLNGFRKKVQEAMGGIRGCTHVNELLGAIPTAAVQMLSGLKKREDEGEGKPFQLDRCHALDTTGAVVQRYYPKWYKGAA